MNYYRIYRFFLTSIAAISFLGAAGQRVVPEKELIDLALKNSGALQSSQLQVTQNKYLQKTGFNIPNPEVIAESPSGEFYAVGVLQSMEFPSVYFKQNQLRRQITRLSEKQKDVTLQQVNSLIRSLYLDLQFTEALYAQLQLQDSLYSIIARSAERQFDAGTIDHLAKTFAQSQVGEVHNQFVQASLEYEAIKNQIRAYTGIGENFRPTELVRLPFQRDAVVDSTAVTSNPSIQYYEQLVNVNKQTLSVERNKALPGLVFGYLNQGSKETETYYRFRVGFTVPLWFWQYNGSIRAAKAGVQVAEQNEKAQFQTLAADIHQASGDVRKYDESLNYYERTGLRQSDDIINTARRFFESGQIDYVAYLRNINEAYLVKARYLETLRNYNQAVITINYLTGRL
jgi:outer membrane protein, heavy metal efflux system